MSKKHGKSAAKDHSVMWITEAGEVTRETERAEPTREEIEKFVAGNFEPVYVSHDQIAFVNEDGRRLGLSYNEKASELADQPLLGNAVFVRRLTATVN